MDIIPQKIVSVNPISSTLEKFHVENRIGDIMKRSNFNKEKGISCINVFKFLFSIVFTGKIFFRALDNEKSLNFGKDVVYRFLNSVHFNWSCFLLSLSTAIINDQIVPLTSKRIKVFVIDDSVYSRNRSKHVELLARVHDHSQQKYVKGLRMLTLGWSDGNTFMPVSFNLLSSVKSTNILSPMDQNIDKRTNGYKRRIDAQIKETDAMYKLIEAAGQKGISADYVLFDSWFTYPAVIKKLKEMKMQVIAMVKAMPTVYYEFNGERKNLAQIYKSVHKRRGKAKILSTAYVTIDDGKIPLKIVFVRDRNRSKKWLALITTDIKISEEEIVQTYGKRWDIEVFFKYCKSYLNLAKEFFCRNYDALVAHTTIVFSRYIMLAVESRNNNDDKTIGSLFRYCCEELQDISVSQSLQILLKLLISALKNTDIFLLSKKELESFIDRFISSLPSCFKGLMPNFSCES